MNIVVHVRLYVYFKHFEAKIQSCSVKQVLDELFTLLVSVVWLGFIVSLLEGGRVPCVAIHQQDALPTSAIQVLSSLYTNIVLITFTHSPFPHIPPPPPTFHQHNQLFSTPVRGHHQNDSERGRRPSRTPAPESLHRQDPHHAPLHLLPPQRTHRP